MNDEAKMLPRAPEVEQAVLGVLLGRSETDKEEVERVRADHFSDRANRLIFSTIMAMREKGESADLVTVTTRIKDLGLSDKVGGVGYISKLSTTYSLHASSQYVKILEDKFKLRRVIELSAMSSGAAYEGGKPDEILKKMEVEIFSLHETGSVESLTGKASDDVLATLQIKRTGERILGLQTDITPWDQMLGGLLKARFYVLAARAGRGKTAIMEQAVTRQLVDQNPTLVFEKDMSVEMLISRMACRIANVPFFKFDLGTCSPYEYSGIEAAVKFLKASPLYVYSPSNMTASDLRAIVKREKRLHGIKSVFLDHVLNLDVGRESYREGLTMASAQIRASVQDSELPHVILAQLNREADKTARPSPAHIKEFDALYADCDVMAMLWSDKDVSDYAPGQLYPVKFTVNKNRYGAQFEQEMGFDRSLMKFKSMGN